MDATSRNGSRSSQSSRVDVVVIGAGHAGLALSGLLTHEGREHVVVERRETLGGGWQDRWDQFRLVTPNWTSSFPGWAYDGPDPDGFMTRDEIAARVARYAAVVGAPMALGTDVRRLTGQDGSWELTTSRGRLSARQVVVATGSYHRPRLPAPREAISARVRQLHSHEYRNERALPPGAVLVVGSGQTGLQLAEELFEAGRRVFVSVGSAGRIPRRYRGRDVYSWIVELLHHGDSFGITLPTPNRSPDPSRIFAAMPALSGHRGGHDTNLRQYAADGITLAGRLTGAAGERLTFADDLDASLERTDAFFAERFQGLIDAYIDRAGIEAPPDDRVAVEYRPNGLTDLNLLREGVSTVIWSTGYELDYGWIEPPVVDARGYPRNRRGVASVPGLYFLGLLWQHSQASASLVGPELDAPYLVDVMGRQAPRRPRGGGLRRARAHRRAGSVSRRQPERRRR
jgi:putative flavoprotein involved in K+ transport